MGIHLEKKLLCDQEQQRSHAERQHAYIHNNNHVKPSVRGKLADDQHKNPPTKAAPDSCESTVAPSTAPHRMVPVAKIGDQTNSGVNLFPAGRQATGAHMAEARRRQPRREPAFRCSASKQHQDSKHDAVDATTDTRQFTPSSAKQQGGPVHLSESRAG